MYDTIINKNQYKDTFLKSLKEIKITTCILQKFLFDNKDVENINDKKNI